MKQRTEVEEDSPLRWHWASTWVIIYYTIQLEECSKDITTIITKFGKFRYFCLPMGMVVSGDVFQSKIYDLIGGIH